MIGKTIITTDGTTLLGADNKAGVAVIMETAAFLMQHPEIPHGPIRVCFSCDEEIGHGTDKIDLEHLAADVGYTLDGPGEGVIEAETFSADKAIVTIHGANIHPAIAKGKMINAIRLAGMFLERLPRLMLTPETTSDREGFIHPYRIEGGVGKVEIQLLLRDFVTPALTEQAQLLREVAKLIMTEYPRCVIDVRIHNQYRNMADGMGREPRALPFAVEAIKRAGITPHIGSIRGGTDGALLTAKGLPTPNIFTGEHNFHSPLEWTCLEEMQSAVRVLLELVQLWGQEKKA
jgi:tripeptide aminopeptidase